MADSTQHIGFKHKPNANKRWHQKCIYIDDNSEVPDKCSPVQFQAGCNHSIVNMGQLDLKGHWRVCIKVTILQSE